ncbi:MAG TPA: aromatic ring-hydroxylating dioxygenase subunit alpha [Ilumatobacter sp.]|nr:aromatic ring-hydroxylating dioxygenase subunit alpha [Ilumatobacter sp.]
MGAVDEYSGERMTTRTTLPRDAYVSDDVFEAEVQRIFLRQWTFVAHESQLDGPGAYVTDEIAGEGFILVRDDDRQLHALLNTCRHRGHRLCEEAHGAVRRFVCPYHQWSYRLDGSLTHVPGSPAQLEHAEWSLHRGHVQVWHGLVFVSLSESAPPPLTPALDALASDMTHARPERLKEAFRESYAIAANWKIVLENYLECYHCRINHPELCASMALDEMYATTDSWSGQYLGGATPIKPGHLTMSIDGGLIAPPLSGHAVVDGASAAPDSGFAIVPMLTRLICHVDHLVVHLLRPIDARHTRWETRWLVTDTAVEGVDFDIDALTTVWRATNRQDIPLCESAARGVQSRRFVPGPLHPELESAVGAALDVYRQLMDQT